MSSRKKARRGSVKTEQSRSGLSERTAELLCVGAILILACALILPNLGNIYMWQDEAQTACVARTILTHGVPVGYDGKNHFSQQFGAEYGKNYIWIWHTWLPFYILAGFFAVFGTSTFVCRLPFALAGIGTVVMIYYYAKMLWRSRRAGVLAAVILLLNVPFLLLVRQCRYYSMTALFALAGLYAYSEMMRGRRYASVAFVISACLLFHTFYVYLPALLAAVIIHAAIYHRDRLRHIVVTSLIAAAVNLPWMIYFAGVYKVAHPSAGILQRSAIITVNYLVQIVKHVFSPGLLLITALVTTNAWIRRGRPRVDPENRRHVILMLLFAACVLVVLAPTSPNSFFRYLAPVIPALILIAALIVESGMKLHPAVGVIALLLLAYWAQMPSYLYEIRHDYNGGVEGIVRYLTNHAGRDDIVAVNHEDLPIKFYTNLRVISGITGEDYSAAKDADWVIIRRHLTRGEGGISKYLLGLVKSHKYEVATLKQYPDVPFENREDPESHQFRTVKGAKPVLIFHRSVK